MLLSGVLLCALVSSTGARRNPPIVIVPGLAGSRIQGTFNGENGPHFWCRSHTWQWKDLWIDFTNFLKPYISCFAHHMGLHLNLIDGHYENNHGVRTRVMDFGALDGTRYLDVATWVWPSVIGYLNETERFFAEKGYTAGKDLHSAPYDWRYSLDGVVDNTLEVDSDEEKITFNERLKKLIEETSKRNGYKVLLVGHSYGCTVSQVFLQLQSKAWRDRYIHKLVHFAPPYLGSVDAIAGYIAPSFGAKPLQDPFDRPSGIILGAQFFLKNLREMYKLMLPNAASVVTLMPVESPVPVAITEEREYYSSDIEEVLTALNKTSLLAMRKRTYARQLALPLPEPDVDTVVAYSTDLPTPWTYHYRGKLNSTFNEDYPTRVDMKAGDGTVPLYSLEQHKQWKRQPSLVHLLRGVKHSAVFEDTTVNELLFSLLPAAKVMEEFEQSVDETRAKVEFAEVSEFNRAEVEERARGNADEKIVEIIA